MSGVDPSTGRLRDSAGGSPILLGCSSPTGRTGLGTGSRAAGRMAERKPVGQTEEGRRQTATKPAKREDLSKKTT
jgi:hypothetical protein